MQIAKATDASSDCIGFGAPDVPAPCVPPGAWRAVLLARQVLVRRGLRARLARVPGGDPHDEAGGQPGGKMRRGKMKMRYSSFI